ncbi:MAG: hypothetical protein OEM26_05430 [Saprospiraceae bacterium]|nr:hypothetical protein [Saprospiraceae bacterium]
MKQRTLPLLFLFVISFFTVRVTALETACGTVVNAGDRTPLLAVSVHLENRETIETATGIDGSFESAKQGLSPGVKVNNESGMVGFNVDADIRGISSINARQQPLSRILSIFTFVKNVYFRSYHLALAPGLTYTIMPPLPSKWLESLSPLLLNL